MINPQTLARRRILLGLAGLLVPLAAGFLVRASNLSAESAWYDEVITLEVLDAPTLSGFLEGAAKTSAPMPPAYFVLEYYAAKLGPDPEFSLRVLSVLIGLASIAIVQATAWRIYGPWAGFVAGAAMAASPIHVYYSQEIRGYELTTLLGGMSALTFMELLRRNRRSWLLLNFVANTLLVWTHPFAALALGAQAALLVLFRRKELGLVAPWMTLAAVTSVSIGLWGVSLDRGVAYQQMNWIQAPGFFSSPSGISVYGAFVAFAGNFYGHPTNQAAEMVNRYREPIQTLTVAITAFLVIAYIGFARGHRTCTRGEGKLTHREAACFFGLWLLFPPLALYALSYLWTPCFFVRYLLFSSVALYVIMGAGMTRVTNRALSGALMGMLLAIWAVQIVTVLPGPSRADWSSLASLMKTANPDHHRAIVAQTVGDNRKAFAYHLADPAYALEPARNLDSIVSAIDEAETLHEDLWVAVPWGNGMAVFDPPLFQISWQMEDYLRLIGRRFTRYEARTGRILYLYHVPWSIRERDPESYLLELGEADTK